MIVEFQSSFARDLKTIRDALTEERFTKLSPNGLLATAIYFLAMKKTLRKLAITNLSETLTGWEILCH